jgi:hypothetical protein
MHSFDPYKNKAEFQREFEAILRAAEDRGGVADFTKFVFPEANCAGTLTVRCVFFEAMFTQDANFRGATFTQATDFSGARFMQNANFIRTTFTQDANFFEAKFTQDANFLGATFTQDADFTAAAFTRNADFSRAAFTRKVEFVRAKFFAAAWFRETRFRRDIEVVPGPVFSLAELARPEAVVFYKAYLGQALFYNCDVSKLTFSSVEWRRRKRGGKRMVFEEEVDLYEFPGLRPDQNSFDKRDYGLIAELYQQLKRTMTSVKTTGRPGIFITAKWR